MSRLKIKNIKNHHKRNSDQEKYSKMHDVINGRPLEQHLTIVFQAKRNAALPSNDQTPNFIF